MKTRGQKFFYKTGKNPKIPRAGPGFSGGNGAVKQTPFLKKIATY
jgi:hypothetical protein